jgi:hypothetical protein
MYVCKADNRRRNADNDRCGNKKAVTLYLLFLISKYLVKRENCSTVFSSLSTSFHS